MPPADPQRAKRERMVSQMHGKETEIKDAENHNRLHENRIADLDMYLTRMQRSLLDKMFFIDKVFEPFTHIVDFGCANGELIKALQTMCGTYTYVGYDIAAEMIDAARKNVPQARFTTQWQALDVPFESALLNISSTLHEVYSYGTAQDVEQFWERVFGSGFRYVTIRDMMVSEREDRTADADALCAVRVDTVYSRQLADYEQVWGPIETQHSLVHYLLKYKYTNNWDREVRENYLPLTVEALLRRIPANYRIVYQDHSTLPFAAWQIRKDFGVRLQTPTHLKIILERIA